MKNLLPLYVKSSTEMSSFKRIGPAPKLSDEQPKEYIKERRNENSRYVEQNRAGKGVYLAERNEPVRPNFYEQPRNRPGFKDELKKLLFERCKLKKATINKCFDTDFGWRILSQAFVSKTVDSNPLLNNELLEFEGDPILNGATIRHISRRMVGLIDNPGWMNEFKAYYVSDKVLGAYASDILGFKEKGLVAYTDRKNGRVVPDFEEFKIFEDVMEALCGAIMQICDKTLPAGVGFRACCNLVDSLLDQDEKIEMIKEWLIKDEWEKAYIELFPMKTRLKQIVDRIKDLELPHVLITVDIKSDSKEDKKGRKALNKLINQYNPKFSIHTFVNNIKAEQEKEEQFRNREVAIIRIKPKRGPSFTLDFNDGNSIASIGMIPAKFGNGKESLRIARTGKNKTDTQKPVCVEMIRILKDELGQDEIMKPPKT